MKVSEFAIVKVYGKNMFGQHLCWPVAWNLISKGVDMAAMLAFQGGESGCELLLNLGKGARLLRRVAAWRDGIADHFGGGVIVPGVKQSIRGGE